MLSRGRRLSAQFLTLAGALLLGTLGLEVALQLFVDVTDVPFYFWDPTTGPRIAPHQRGLYIAGDHMKGRYSFNAQGWNHPDDYVVPKPADRHRVCLVGDSQVESLQVLPDETMYAVAERRAAEAGRPTQWYAFGVSGFGTAQEFETIRRYVLDYRPEVVILLFVQNDPFDTSPYLVDLAPHVVRYVLDRGGDLSLMYPSFWKPVALRRLSARSALVRYLMIQKRLRHRLRVGAPAPAVGGLPVREDAGDFRNPVVEGLDRMSMAERQEKTWTLIARLFEAARDECRRRGAIFAVAFRGWPDEIDAPLQPETVTPVSQDSDPQCLGPRVREMGRERVGPIAASLGIPYLDLTEALRAAVARTGRSHRFPDDGHYSAVGHAAAGEALAEWVETLRPAGR
jgi:hypothetical protein